MRLTAPVVSLALAWAGANAQEPKDVPFPSPMVETTGVALMLLDVEVTDDRGRPLPGLSEQDFEIRLDGRRWPIYSVDDLCRCSAASVAQADLGPAAEGTRQPTSSPDRLPDPISFVLYFDFSQLQMDGRINALAASRTWIRNDLRHGDRAMLVAYTSNRGLRELTSMTSDREVLLSALDEAEADITLVDTFPDLFWDRVRQCTDCCEECDSMARIGGCQGCCPDCAANARDEYQHGRRSLKALQRLLTRLEGVPGRKAVVFFNQNGMLYPERFYPIRENTVGDHLALMDVVAAEATTARAVLYPAYSGDLRSPRRRSPVEPDNATFVNEISDLAVNLGANLADFTGGKYTRAATVLPEFLSGVGRGCACIYRVAVEPPTDDRWKVYRAKVKVAGHRVPYLYRIQYLTPMDRWWRKATDALLNPERVSDLLLSAALVPTRITEKGWTAEITVLVDVDSLLTLPAGDRQYAEWEVGALLQPADGRRTREMLGVSQLRRESEESTERVIVHKREFRDLRPGSYRLGAFVRDRNANLFGAAEATLQLPVPNRDGIAGPVLIRTRGRCMQTDLPLWTGGEPTRRTTRTTEIRIEPVPLAGRVVPVGENLEARSWLCSTADGSLAPTLRYVSADGTPLFRFEAAELLPDGTCYEVSDTIQTGRLVPGRYAYHVRWKEHSALVEFEVAATEAPGVSVHDPAYGRGSGSSGQPTGAR